MTCARQGLVSVFIVLLTLAPAMADGPGRPAARSPFQAAADDLTRSIRRVSGHLILGGAVELDRGDLPTPTTIALLAGSGSVLSLIDLGDISPLKASVPDLAWRHLVAQRPAMAQTVVTLATDLTTTLIAELDGRQLETARLLAAASAAALFAVSSAPNTLQEGLLVYSAGWMLAPLQDAAAVRKLAWLAVNPGVPADVRKEAGAILASSAALVLQQRIAEARFLAAIGGQ